MNTSSALKRNTRTKRIDKANYISATIDEDLNRMLLLKAVIIVFVLVTCMDGYLLPGRDGPRPYLVSPLMVSVMEETGWRMVFRATSGNKQDVYNAWTKGVGVSTTKPADMGRSYTSHYRDPSVTHWENLTVQYVKLALYKQSQEVAYIVFDALNTDIVSWFNGSRVEASSWSDLTRQNSFNYFSIQGHNTNTLERTFFINRQYGGCDKDLGHLVVIEHDGDCGWDHEPIYPTILYSDLNGADYWNRREFGRADYLAIFISTEPTASIIG